MSGACIPIPSISQATAEKLLHGYVFGAHPHWSVIKASGDGLHAYLQGQITQDMAILSPAQAIHACLLTPQGKAVCELYLAEGHHDELLILAPAAFAEDAVARLRRFALGYRLRIGIVETLRLWSVQGAAGPELLDQLQIPQPGENWLASSRHAKQELVAMLMQASPKGFWLLSDSVLQGICDDSCIEASELEAMRIIRGLPRFGSEWGTSEHPLNANLIELNGVSFDKGCYVGQEVTSRMHWRGGIKKKLYRVQLPDAGGDYSPSLPCPVLSTAVIGELRSLARDHEGACYGIALLPIEAAESGCSLRLADGAELCILEPCHV